VSYLLSTSTSEKEHQLISYSDHASYDDHDTCLHFSLLLQRTSMIDCLYSCYYRTTACFHETRLDYHLGFDTLRLRRTTVYQNSVRMHIDPAAPYFFQTPSHAQHVLVFFWPCFMHTAVLFQRLYFHSWMAFTTSNGCLGWLDFALVACVAIMPPHLPFGVHNIDWLGIGSSCARDWDEMVIRISVAHVCFGGNTQICLHLHMLSRAEESRKL
jgi:hypothetical protein